MSIKHLHTKQIRYCRVDLYGALILKVMTGFLKRLTGLIHWAGFLMTVFVSYLYLTEPVNYEPLMKVFIALLPNTIGWLIKYIFTGNSKFLPF